MVIKLTNQPTTLRNNAALVKFRPRFAGVATEVAKGATDVAHLGIAENIKKAVNYFGLTRDVRVGGLSLEDISGRLQTFFGVYILQGYYASKEHKHPYETNGRNALVWLMTLALTNLTKSEKFGVNTLFLNPIMSRRGTHVKAPTIGSGLPVVGSLIQKASETLARWTQKGLDKIRMDASYMQIIERSGIKIKDDEKLAAMKGSKALWASSWLDANRIEHIENLQRTLANQLKAGTLKDADRVILDSIPGFFKRINTFNIASISIITAATVYFIGGVAMKIVNHVFTPLDKNDKNNKPDTTPKPALTPTRPPFTPMRPTFPSPHQPFVSNFPPPTSFPASTMVFQPNYLRQFPNQQGGLN